MIFVELRTKIAVLLVLLAVFSSCNNRPFHGTRWDLGNNKEEFQKVLTHYQQSEDSLKLRAAEFLIEHMKGEYYYKSKHEKEQDEFLRNIPAQISIPYAETTKQYEYLRRKLVDEIVYKAIKDGSINKPKYRKYYDSKTLTAEFLIENIEYAFKAWDFPWARPYSFEDFCRYILPYRCGTEAPESWRKKYYNEFKWIADSLKNTNDPLKVASLINEQFRYELSFSSALKKSGFKLKITNHVDAMIYESCYGETRLGVCLLRALGIPATTNHIPKWGHVSYGHELTAMLDSENKWHYFNFGEFGPEKDLNFQPPKMYLKQFGKSDQNKSIYKDASDLLMKVTDLEIDSDVSPKDEIYLCIFGNLAWYPLCKGIHKKSSVIFENVGVGKRMYLAAMVSPNGKIKPVSNAFSTDTEGNIIYYKPDFNNTFTNSFARKFTGWGAYNLRRVALIGGEFFISDSPDFSNEKSIYKITDTLNYYLNIIDIEDQKGKYLRYKFPNTQDSVFDGPAEVVFYSSDHKGIQKLEGKYFGSPLLSPKHIKLLTDEDILTYMEVWKCDEDVDLEVSNFVFKTENQSLWMGMELDDETTVSHVGICPRNDKNGVYAGMHYELFYWDDSWISLGEKEATSESICFDGIPENSVLWLRNLDEGKEERIFTLKSGKQVWW